MKRTFYLIICLTCLFAAKAQQNCSFTHYSSEDGLSQNTVMSIIQDHKGNMWFGTWSGLNKFDGYSFKSYKAKQGSRIALSNDRINQLCEDFYGFIWVLTYDNHVYRFDPRTETFERVPAESEAGGDIAITSIKTLPNGSVWLLTQARGAIRVTTDAKTHRFTTQWFSGESSTSPIICVEEVVLDEAGNEWMLTDNGLGTFTPGQNTPVSYFTDTSKREAKEKQAFYTFAESADELYFGSDEGRIVYYQKSTGRFQSFSLNVPSRVVSLKKLNENELLAVTATDGVFICQFSTKTWEHYTTPALAANPVHSTYLDQNSEVWFEQYVTGFIAHFNARTKTFKTETVAVEPVGTERSLPAFHIHEDIYGTVWVHPYGGGFSYYDTKTSSLHPFYNSVAENNWRFSNKIHAAFSDKQGNLWLGTHSKGLEKVTFRTSQFKLVTPVAHPYESSSNEVRSLYEDSEGNFWVGLKDGKLRVYGSGGSDCGYLTETGTISHTGTSMKGNAYSVMQDSKGDLWIATKGDGLVKAECQSNGRYKLTRYLHNEDDKYSLSNNDVYCAYEDTKGRIWVATFGGGVNYLTHDQSGKEIFINHRNGLKNYPANDCYRVRCITGDGQGRVWIGTTVGALMVDEAFDAPEDAKFHKFVRDPEDSSSLSNNDVHWIQVSRDKQVYLATFGGGLNKLLSVDAEGNARFKCYSVNDGLPSDVLFSICEDSKGNLWMSTESGVSKFTPSTEEFEAYINPDIARPVRFSEAASAYTSSGNILFGASDGILIFNPDSIHKSSYIPPVVFTELLVSNKDVRPATEGSILKQELDETDKLVLSHKENIFTIQYAALDYYASSEIQYAYILEGFEEAWNYVGKQRTATYTNLPKGEYLFKVRSTNAEGVWTENVRTLKIEIKPSFWETPFAYFLYVFFVLLIIVAAVYILFTIYRLKHEVSVEQQMTDLKLRFFTDISHELRTPLTLISGPVEYVLENTSLPDDAREQLQVVERNTNRMLRLINQILDFRKIQNKKMKMQVSRIDVVSFTRMIMDNFESVAEEHHINFLFEAENKEVYLWVDTDKYEKIIYNLLSNAFKYTPIDKMIKVSIHENENTITVSVQDQGIGIAENKRKSIFLRFENLVDKKLFNQASTGIGLSLVKELVEMHKAVIMVDSKEGEGSCFSVDFQKGKDHYDSSVEFLQDDMAAGVEPAAAVADVETVATQTPAEDEMKAEDVTTETGTKNKGTMLLVEDNPELRMFLRSIFTPEYRIIEAVDGTQGLNKALRSLPDIIISDVMMPGKDGITMVRELRADMTTSHILIVLLTAKTSIESRIESLESGADDYITKPFSATYLKARVKNLLTQRQKLQEMFRTSLMPSSTSTEEQTEEEQESQVPEMSSNERKFMDKLMGLMEKNMDNGDLIVDDLVQEMAVSRSVFFKKLKTLTGLAPIEFIKEMRINRSVELIETGEYSMTQIAYMVGINDPRYFSKCFKQKMGMTPSEYKEKMKNKNA